MKLKNGNDTLCIFYDMNFSENFKELQIQRMPCKLRAYKGCAEPQSEVHIGN